MCTYKRMYKIRGCKYVKSVTFRLSEQDIELLEQLAAARGISKTQYIRDAIHVCTSANTASASVNTAEKPTEAASELTLQLTKKDEQLAAKDEQIATLHKLLDQQQLLLSQQQQLSLTDKQTQLAALDGHSAATTVDLTVAAPEVPTGFWGRLQWLLGRS